MAIMLKIWLTGIALYFSLTLLSQKTELQQFFQQEELLTGRWKLNDTAAVREFYALTGFQTVWTGEESVKNKQILLTLLQHAEDQGLEIRDYQFDFISELKNPGTPYPAIEIEEIVLTDAAIHYFRDLSFGNNEPIFSYKGLPYKPSSITITRQLAKHIKENTLQDLSTYLEPSLKEITIIKAALFQLRKKSGQQLIEEDKVVSSRVNNKNKPLLEKLYLLGLLDSINGTIPDKTVLSAVKKAQQLFGLLGDGVIRATFLQEINVPIKNRIKHLIIALNYYRWLNGLALTQPVIVVNIPAAYLRVYSNGHSILEMRTIVGKPSTPTPTVSSKITEVVLYPYWTVPSSIARKEILPMIKRNPGFVDANNYQVLNRSGQVVNPYTINWASLSLSNFPYVIRQSTGCDNALGLIKFNFFNPYSVYLHDTPSKSLFMLNKRFFSHGCMRVENPMELGHFVLKENGIAIDTLEAKGCLRNQSPIPIAVKEPVPVVVWYNPAGLNAAGKLVFYEDPYRKLVN